MVAVPASSYPCYRNLLGTYGCVVASVAVDRNYNVTATELAAAQVRPLLVAAAQVRVHLVSVAAAQVRVNLVSVAVRALSNCQPPPTTHLPSTTHHTTTQAQVTAPSYSY